MRSFYATYIYGVPAKALDDAGDLIFGAVVVAAQKHICSSPENSGFPLPLRYSVPDPAWLHLTWRTRRSRNELPVLCHRCDLEPDGIQSWQEHERENRPAEGTPDQGVCQRSPENRLGERNDRQHGGERRQNDRT